MERSIISGWQPCPCRRHVYRSEGPDLSMAVPELLLETGKTGVEAGVEPENLHANIGWKGMNDFLLQDLTGYQDGQQVLIILL